MQYQTTMTWLQLQRGTLQRQQIDKDLSDQDRRYWKPAGHRRPVDYGDETTALLLMTPVLLEDINKTQGRILENRMCYYLL